MSGSIKHGEQDDVVDLNSLNMKQNVQIVELFYDNRRSLKNGFRKLCYIYDLDNRKSIVSE